MGFGGMVNHSSDPDKQNAALEYCPGSGKINENAGQVIYRITKDVEAGQEIIGNYGDQIGPEVERQAWLAAQLKSEKEEWEAFLEKNPYGLKDFINSL